MDESRVLKFGTVIVLGFLGACAANSNRTTEEENSRTELQRLSPLEMSTLQLEPPNATGGVRLASHTEPVPVKNPGYAETGRAQQIEAADDAVRFPTWSDQPHELAAERINANEVGNVRRRAHVASARRQLAGTVNGQQAGSLNQGVRPRLGTEHSIKPLKQMEFPSERFPLTPITAPRTDVRVQPASLTTAAILAPVLAADVSTTGPVNLGITKIKQDNYVWPVDGQTTRIQLLTRSGTVAIEGEASTAVANVELLAYYGNRDQPKVFGPHAVTNHIWNAPTVTLVDQNDILNKVVIKDTTTDTTTAPIAIATPSQLLLPKITLLSNNARGPYVSLASSDPVNVFHRYIRLTGNNVRPATELRFLVFKTESGTHELLSAVPAPEGFRVENDFTWSTALRFPGTPDLVPSNSGVLRVMVIQPGTNDYRFADDPIPFVIPTPDPNLKQPSFSLDYPIVKLGNNANVQVNRVGDAYYSNRETFKVTATKGQNEAAPSEARLVVLLNSAREIIGDVDAAASPLETNVTIRDEGSHQLRLGWMLGDKVSHESEPLTISVRTRGPRVLSVEPTNFASTPGKHEVTVTFDEAIADTVASNIATTNPFQLLFSDGHAVALEDDSALLDNGSPAKLSDDKKSITIKYKTFTPDSYTFNIDKTNVTDLYGNKMEQAFSRKLLKPIGAELPITSRGVTGPTGPPVSYPEYTKPRPFQNGFNPSDHVETRVSRLYYYRNAHRVAQIVNRGAKSFNQAAVNMQEQLADKSRTIANQATDDRRAKEERAVRAAQQTREAENELRQAQTQAANAANQAALAIADQQRITNTLRNTPNDPANANAAALRADLQAELDTTSRAVGQLESVADAARRRARSAQNKVESLREQEAQANEEWQRSIAVEDRAREEQFRREVAAAHADPDTYAAGDPESEDPVRQVSVSVIGEGLIQLRGPIKGINIIRTMINQIDAPVGQVRVGVHTVQINGEKGDRMEKVAGKIQRLIDHSRFLTLQSAEMLRKSIVAVAAQKASEMGGMPGMTQAERDQKYLYSFFGEDFTRELEVIDSEFLHTGNKLLSIHSMDSTSLASAMFVMALAKNSTRMQILDTFQGMMTADLPMAEQNYFEAGLTCDGKQQLYTRHCKRNDFEFLSYNARFQSIRGMFDAHAGADDTMTPIQREFVRLAQIFKSRLIVEIELKQRIMERAVIEERLGNHQKELQDAKRIEDEATEKLRETQEKKRNARLAVLRAATPIQAKASLIADQAAKAKEMSAFATRTVTAIYVEPVVSWYKNTPQPLTKSQVSEIEEKLLRPLLDEKLEQRLVDVAMAKGERKGIESGEKLPVVLGSTRAEVQITMGKVKFVSNRDAFVSRLLRLMEQGRQTKEILDQFNFKSINKDFKNQADEIFADLERRLKHLKELSEDEHDALVAESLHRASTMFKYYSLAADHASEIAGGYNRRIRQVVASMGAEGTDYNVVYSAWLGIEDESSNYLGGPLKQEVAPLFRSAADGFQDLLAASLEYQAALQYAQNARQPLDHKKFLDMLVDEMEDKYIELLEGTRAHTANIDGYIKRLMTSLDDDFNTQFYYPTFRKVRLASQLWDVQMGQVETTNVLANNRSFAKVTPEATMEFDLPKRDVLINEAINGAKSTIQDIGALAADPTFLSLAKLNSGQPTSSQFGGANGGLSTVRNVLPGLSTDSAESVLGQQGPGVSQFGAAMESLIPEPAIYKFETGTGWEIRPVLQPDGQALVFDFNYMYTTNVREPVRADEKHLGRVKRHFVNTDVQLSNFELREISRYTVALKASRTARGVPLLEDIPGLGVVFRPLPSDESSLQQNLILGQATIFPTLFDLMGLRWAPVVADLDPLRLQNEEFVVRNRKRSLMNRVFDKSSSEVDKFLRIPDGERRMDLYRSQETMPSQHPNGYIGPGANLRDSHMQEGYDPEMQPESQFIPGSSKEGSPLRPPRPLSGTSNVISDGYSTYEGQPMSEFESVVGDATIVQGPRFGAPIPVESRGIPVETVVPNYGAGEEVPTQRHGHRGRQPFRVFNRSN